MAQRQGPVLRRYDFFWSSLDTYIWQEDVAKISQVPGAPRNVNPAQE